MTFTEAEQKLKEIADGKYCMLRFEKTINSHNGIETECELYIHGDGAIDHGATWDMVFAAREVRVNKTVEHNPDSEAA